MAWSGDEYASVIRCLNELWPGRLSDSEAELWASALEPEATAGAVVEALKSIRVDQTTSYRPQIKEVLTFLRDRRRGPERPRMSDRVPQLDKYSGFIVSLWGTLWYVIEDGLVTWDAPKRQVRRWRHLRDQERRLLCFTLSQQGDPWAPLHRIGAQEPATPPRDDEALASQ